VCRRTRGRRREVVAEGVWAESPTEFTAVEFGGISHAGRGRRVARNPESAEGEEGNRTYEQLTAGNVMKSEFGARATFVSVRLSGVPRSRDQQIAWQTHPSTSRVRTAKHHWGVVDAWPSSKVPVQASTAARVTVNPDRRSRHITERWGGWGGGGFRSRFRAREPTDAMARTRAAPQGTLVSDGYGEIVVSEIRTGKPRGARSVPPTHRAETPRIVRVRPSSRG